jgi:hypothetical protein
VRAVAPRPAQPAAVPTDTPDPSSATPQVIDVASDPNARSSRTPLPTLTPGPPATPAPSPAPTVQAADAGSVVDDVLASSFEPLLAGGRLGLLAAGSAGLAALLVRLLRRHGRRR